MGELWKLGKKEQALVQAVGFGTRKLPSFWSWVYPKDNHQVQGGIAEKMNSRDYSREQLAYQWAVLQSSPA